MRVARRLPVLDEVEFERSSVALAALAVNTELLAVLAYFLASDAQLVDPRFTLYGLVWVNVAAAVLFALDPPEVARRTRLRAGAVAVGYFAVLAYVGGLVGPAPATAPSGFQVVWLPPGWGPAVAYGGEYVGMLLMPAKVLGYAALSALLYVAVVDVAGAAVSGVLGVLSCVSCSWPVVAGLATAVAGGGSAIAAATTPLAYDLSTLVFLVTVTLLWWRPTLR
ncbi:MAG: hypothetical protein ABEJ79_09795 [Halolamina sp.]